MRAFLFILFFFPTLGFSQDHQNIISGNILGSSSAIGLSYERIVSDNLSLELGIGLIGIGAGATVYPWKIQTSSLCFYTGFKVSSFVLVDVGGGTVAYGVSFFSPANWMIGLDVGPANGKLVSSSFGGATSETTRFYIYGNFRLGFRF
jgi:hypothetical protein